MRYLHKRMIIVVLVSVMMIPVIHFFLPQKVLSVTVFDRGETIVIQSTEADVAGLLIENGIEILEKDRVEPAVHSPLTDGLVINITRAKDIRLVIDGETKELRTTAQSVEEVLAQENVILGPEDRTAPVLAAACPELIQVIRVNKEILSEQKEIPYTVEKVPSEKMHAGIEQVRQKGIKGLEKYIYEVVLEDGKQVSKRLIEKALIRQPIKQVVEVGMLKMISREAGTLNFSDALSMTATAYTHTGNKTYTDIWPSVGIVAVDPKVIPLRTRLYIEGYGYATAMDTGGAIKGNRIDLFFETRQEALKWGRRNVQVFILDN